ncbi:type VI secretion system baseplate subunit TssF [Methylobacter sp. S3L5C]|uniref:type VI secretion system baseplate subunit TssF n=1 Tax=Methylobacter sp. S3L5C TaxID=2839024 RepID=UPI001FAD4B6A|nr:type VI secretion system baseplate subunit TssF [Methylobacter sp. S3L5C]UOA10465.1 type VI secretion system baseplate subunit TssF [Methylobacter sp. S3L5C]
MSLDNTQYRAFLEELHDLADSRLNYALDYPAAGLEGDDPDVKRIIEALAFFGARTQIAVSRSLDSNNRRLYQQFFSFLLTPLAAMAMIQAKPTGHLTEVLDLPAGTEIGLQPEKGALVMFRTTRSMRILPMSLETVKQELLSDAGNRLLLTFKANYPLNEQPETINLHIDYLNDLTLSLKVLNFLGRSLKSAGVQFGAYDPDQPCLPCEFRLGGQPADIATDEWNHPLEVERYYFHFPQQELYLDLDLPPAPRNWTQFTVVLDCDQPWPRQLRLNRNLFHLFAVPLANNQRAMAQPLICDGTQEHYTIRHPDPQFGFSLEKVLGVYEVGDQGMLPLRPGILAGGNGSYEIEQGPEQENGGNLYRLIPHFPVAFEKPRTLVIEALWQQPWYDQILQGTHTLQAFRRQMQGVQWELMDAAIAHAENRQLSNMSGYIHLLTLMHNASLNAQNTRDLLRALGSVTSGRFQKIFNSLVDLRLEEEPLGEGHKTKQIYTLQFKAQFDDSSELIETFVKHVERVFDIWLADALVETRWEILDETNNTISGERQ